MNYVVFINKNKSNVFSFFSYVLFKIWALQEKQKHQKSIEINMYFESTMT